MRFCGIVSRGVCAVHLTATRPNNFQERYLIDWPSPSLKLPSHISRGGRRLCVNVPAVCVVFLFHKTFLVIAVHTCSTRLSLSRYDKLIRPLRACVVDYGPESTCLCDLSPRVFSQTIFPHTDLETHTSDVFLTARAISLVYDPSNQYCPSIFRRTRTRTY